MNNDIPRKKHQPRKGYITLGDIRGWCGHIHTKLVGAQRCLAKDKKGCREQGGYSDRKIAYYEEEEERTDMEDTILEIFNRIFDAQFKKNGEYWIHSPCSYMTVKFRVFSTSFTGFRTEFEFKGCRNYEFKDNLLHHEDNPSEVYVDGDYGRLVPVEDRISHNIEEFRSGVLYDLEEQVGIAMDVTHEALEKI